MEYLAKLNTCSFHKDAIKRREHMVSAEEVAMDMCKAGAVQGWLIPQYVKELQKSLAPCQALQVVPCNAFLSL